MTEGYFDQEVLFYRKAIIDAFANVDPRFSWRSEVPELFQLFEKLAQDDRHDFQLLCVTLLQDENQEVRIGTLKLLASFGRRDGVRDEVLSRILIAIAVEQENLREEALFALWSIGTRAVLPQLFIFAEKGFSSALYMIRWMIKTPEEIERGVNIARSYIDAEDYELREASLFIIQKYKLVEKEYKGIISAVKKYYDELFIDALKEAAPQNVLESLKELKAAIPEKYSGTHNFFASTIQTLEQKMGRPS